MRKTTERASSSDRVLQYSERNVLIPTSNPILDHAFSPNQQTTSLPRGPRGRSHSAEPGYDADHPTKNRKTKRTDEEIADDLQMKEYQRGTPPAGM